MEIIENPLHEAAKRGNLDLAREMLTIGISVNGLDRAGNTPLHWACRSKTLPLVKLLLSFNPVLNAQNKLGDTPLHSAAWGGNPEIVKLLLDQEGIRKDIQNNDGLAPIDLARNDECGALIMSATTVTLSQTDIAAISGEYDPESD